MQISVTFRQMEPSEALKTYVTDRLKKMKRYLDAPLEAHVVLGLEKFRHLADVTINSNGRIVKGREENTDMYAAIDLVMDKIDMQLRKWREKTRDAKGDRGRAATLSRSAGTGPALPAVRRQRVEVPALELADARALLRKKGEEPIVFSDVNTGILSILCRRPDGQLSLIQPQELVTEGAGPTPAKASAPDASTLQPVSVPVPALDLGEALQYMETRGKDLLVFSELPGGALVALLRRADGSFLLVEPDLA